MKKIVIFILSLLMISAVAYAEEVELSVTIPETFMNVQYSGDAYFKFSIKNNSAVSKEFDVSYSISTDKDTIQREYGKVTIPTLQTEIFTVKDEFPNGAYYVTVEAKSGETVYTSQVLMSVMNKYETQFMQEYSKIGIHSTMEVADPLKPDRFSSNTLINDKRIKLAEMLGFSYIRYGYGISWRFMETDDGQLRDGIVPTEYMNKLANTGASLGFQPVRPSIGAGGNHGQVAKTPEHINDALEFFRKKINADIPRPFYLAEFGNEPDLTSFWPGRDVYGIQYTDLMRHFYLLTEDETKDLTFAGGIVSGGPQAVNFLNYMFAQDAYKYMDAMGYHPYIKTATVDARYDSFSKGFEDAPNGYGGWMQRVITELGWQSVWGEDATYRNHYEKADDIAKMFLKTYLHDLDMTMYYSLMAVDDFGLQANFDNMTPCSIASEQCTTMLNSAQYVGEWHLTDTSECAMFIRDGKPMLAAWIPGDEEYKLTFDTEVTVEDMYGNVIAENTKEVVINSEVKYIYGFGMNYVYALAEDVKNRVIDKVYTEYDGKFNPAVFDGVKALDAQSMSEDFTKSIDMFYDAGDSLIDMFAKGETTLELKELSEILSIMNVAGEKLANVYGITLGDIKCAVSEKYNQVQTKVDELKSVEKHSQILYTDKMLKFARRYYNKAKDAYSRDYNVMRCPIITANSFLSERVSMWAESILPFQEVDINFGILTHARPEQTQFFTSTEYNETQYEIYNKRSIPIDGEVIVVNGKGEQQGEAIPVKVDAEGYTKITVPVYNDKSDLPNDIYKIRLVQNGEIINERWFPITRQASINVEFLETNGTFSDLNSVSVEITNNTPLPISGKVNITSVPDGWSLETTEAEYSLEGLETKSYSFNIDSKKQVAFNNYIFGIGVLDSEGKILYSKKDLLNFPIIVQTADSINVQEFNGDITNWADAYPVYASTPSRPSIPENPETKDEWRKEDTAVITYLKYDAENIYVMSTVYDNIFHMLYKGANSWQSDSIQMYIDPLNNGGASPQADDYDFYGAYTPAGYEMGVCSVSNGKYSVMNENINVLRDEALGITRYMIKIPFASVTPLNSKSNAFRFNMCFNDSDVEIRHRVIEISTGLSSGGKSRTPEKYYEYRFVGFESAADTPLENALVDLTMNPDFRGSDF